MTVKTKVTLIVWWLVAFIWWWVFFVMSMMSKTDPSTDIINSNFSTKQDESEDSSNQEKSKEKTKGKKQESKQTATATWELNNENKNEKEKTPYSLSILTFKWISDPKAEKVFNFKLKKESWGSVSFKSYANLKEYSKDIVYKLATKTDEFDLAIIPSHWYIDISKAVENFDKFHFQIKTPWFNIASIFDYNFEFFTKNNNIRAIPFAIDPIVWYANNKDNDILNEQTFKTWEDLIIKSPNRLTVEWKIWTMPVFLGYDEDYLKFIEKNDSLFPIFDNLLRYYVLKKSEKWVKSLKSFGGNMINKTFSLSLFKKALVKYRAYDFCKANISMCFILWWDSKIVYDFSSKWNFYRENAVDIFRKFKVRPSQIKLTSPALSSSSDEYPARWRVMIINPKIDQKKFVRFLQSYIKMWKSNELPFYKNLVSPFVWNKVNSKHKFFSKYLWRFILLEKFWVNLQNKLNKKELNYLKWKININILLN